MSVIASRSNMLLLDVAFDERAALVAILVVAVI
jgi:hypothetical protein